MIGGKVSATAVKMSANGSIEAFVIMAQEKAATVSAREASTAWGQVVVPTAPAAEWDSEAVPAPVIAKVGPGVRVTVLVGVVVPREGVVRGAVGDVNGPMPPCALLRNR